MVGEGEGERWILQRERYVAIGWLLVQKCNLNRFCKNLLARQTKIYKVNEFCQLFLEKYTISSNEIGVD